MSKYLAVAALLLAAAGCANQQSGSGSVAAASASAPAGAGRMVKSTDGEVEGEVVGTPAPNSKFARVRIGMSQRQVEDLIGPPTDTDSHITGKAFIPFYFGGDTNRQEAFYRNEGVLTYAPQRFGGQANTLIKIAVNPAQQGYAR